MDAGIERVYAGPMSLLCARARWLVAGASLAASTILCSEALAQAPPALTSPPSWTPDQPAPPGYHVERKSNRGLVIAGSLLFGVSYVGVAVPLLIVASHGDGAAAFVVVPIAGPLPVASAQFRGTDAPAAVGGMLVLDALLQAAGAGMLIGGLVGKRVLVPGSARADEVTLSPVPLRFGRSGAGIGVAGAF